jgi:hypothetical protein
MEASDDDKKSFAILHQKPPDVREARRDALSHPKSAEREEALERWLVVEEFEESACQRKPLESDR